ncbi:hypothetical protein ACHSBP_07330 [Pseudoalteromonas sp. XMcav1-K]
MLNKKQLKKSLNSEKAINAVLHSRSPEKEPYVATAAYLPKANAFAAV